MIAGAQTIALAEAYALLHAAGVDAKLATDVFAVSTANCVAIQQRVPVPGVQPAGPASNEWRPGFATEWMAKISFLRCSSRARSTCPWRRMRRTCSASSNRCRPDIASSISRCSVRCSSTHRRARARTVTARAQESRTGGVLLRRSIDRHLRFDRRSGVGADICTQQLRLARDRYGARSGADGRLERHHQCDSRDGH